MADTARYLSPQIVEQVIQNKVQVNLGGDRKVVTVLFSDIRNFTSISEEMPADRLVQILNEYFNEMAHIIIQFQGSLDKYIGDTVNVASRFSGLAGPGQILLIRAAVECIETGTAVREIPPSVVKGKSGELDVYEVLVD